MKSYKIEFVVSNYELALKNKTNVHYYACCSWFLFEILYLDENNHF